MLTGVQPFQKDSALETENAILNETPDPVTNYLEGTPIVLPHTVRKMLAKDPNRRYQHVSDVRIDLEELASNPTDSSLGVPLARAEVTATPGWWRHPIPSTAIGLLILLMGVFLGFLLWNPDSESERSQPVTRFSIALPDNETTSWVPFLALSPDGTQLVYSAVQNDTRRLYRRATDQLEAKPIPGTDGGLDPFFSPDGKWVGFFTDPRDTKGELKKVSLLGGDPVTICEVGTGRGGSWGENATIIFGKWDGLWRVSSNGGTPEPLIAEGRIRYPQILPQGKGVLFLLQKCFVDEDCPIPEDACQVPDCVDTAGVCDVFSIPGCFWDPQNDRCETNGECLTAIVFANMGDPCLRNPTCIDLRGHFVCQFDVQVPCLGAGVCGDSPTQEGADAYCQELFDDWYATDGQDTLLNPDYECAQTWECQNYGTSSSVCGVAVALGWGSPLGKARTL